MSPQDESREIIEIVSRIRARAGSWVQAMTWYRSQPIPAFDGRTAEALVRAGQADAVHEYLDHLDSGGHA